ncbi:MAG: hypothetical protein JNN30_08450 [Rhodanobacteraceae bacterium]|nr:hypothetical protein [Rhodanobacteraceae bacterium]
MTHTIFRRPLRAASTAALLFALHPSTDSIAQDIGVTAITAPVGGCALTANESVTIVLYNYGPTLTAGSSFNVWYSINAGAPVPEMLTLASNLLTNSRLAYTFTTQANLSTPGSYTFDATATLVGDINPTNNATTGYAVTNWATSVGGTLTTPPVGSAGTLTLTGYTGQVVQWEQTDDIGARWFVLSNTSATQTYASLRAPARFRARVRNGLCGEAVSNVVMATP